MGNKAARRFQILVYQSKEKRLVSVNITPDFSYTVSNSFPTCLLCAVVLTLIQVQPNNYGTFYDSSNQNWSVLFKSPEDANKFAIHVALAKFGASDQNGVTTLDTITGKGKVVPLPTSL